MCSSVNQNAQTLIEKGTHFEIIKKGPDLERSISEAISMTDPTPSPSLVKKMFVPTEIEPSVLISLLGIMQDVTDVRHTTGGFQNMPAGAQVKPARPAGTAQTNMRPRANVRVITGQNTAQPRFAMLVIQSNVQGRPASASMPTQQRPPDKQSQQPPMSTVQQDQQREVPPQIEVIHDQEPLTSHMLASAPPEEQKQMLGDRLFPLIQCMHPDLAGKITGMLLEIDNSDLLCMLQSSESLKAKVDEAVVVIQAHQAKEALKSSY
ncbi:hypothetical protein CHS0354_014761 [Potamilus streckersoni]|uniref:PABC domain-containing protein n=1 Tax=Potamilus streckersoni TaxID=2493646 RepID=A0AAE0WAW0_9BIVA|nr:hypothetical protein CHS0354_014761 [Potamilus streckersoni]